VAVNIFLLLQQWFSTISLKEAKGYVLASDAYCSPVCQRIVWQKSSGSFLLQRN